jgi:5'-3' exonuclease
MMRRRRMRKKPTKAILDGDVIAYHTAFWAETENGAGLEHKLGLIVKRWTPKNIDTIEIALSCGRSENFRREIWPRYKLNRDTAYTPEFLSDVKCCIRSKYKTKELPQLEADDILGIYTSSNRAISVTIDKDLKCIPGWHLNPDKDEDLRYITKKEAERFFYIQWMSGDSTDGIPGLWRIGPKKAEKLLNEWEKGDWDKEIIAMYDTEKHRVRDSCDISHPDIAIAMARCVKILTTEGYNLKSKKITLWDPKGGS